MVSLLLFLFFHGPSAETRQIAAAREESGWSGVDAKGNARPQLINYRKIYKLITTEPEDRERGGHLAGCIAYQLIYL